MLERMFLEQPANGKLYVEDVFSTYLYTGNGSSQTITNGIDLAGKGGMVWIKNRTTAAYDHYVADTATGAPSYALATNATRGKTFDFTPYSYVSSLNSNGFSLAVGANDKNDVNGTGQNYASWTFRKAPKFFDVVTFVSDGTANQRVSHNLGVAPGMILVKRSDGVSNWYVYHRSQGINSVGTLQTTGAFSSTANAWGSSDPTATDFGINSGALTATGSTQIAYLFAHDATADGIIQCGSFTTDGTDKATVNLGWEPQFVMVKQSSATSDWVMLDTMRGWPVSARDAYLRANTSAAENVETIDYISPTSTGFEVKGMWGTPGGTSVYIAIRRGPMKTPTVGTSVFNPYAYAGDGVNSKTLPSIGFPSDFSLIDKTNALSQRYVTDRLRGGGTHLSTSATGQEASFSDTTRGVQIFGQTAVTLGSNDGTDAWNQSGNNFVIYNLRRAPGFFDVVAYTGTGANRTVNHNLGVAPELMITKRRNGTNSWFVYNANRGPANATRLESNSAEFATTAWNDTAPTSTVFTVGSAISASGGTYIAYLFASCPGVSKVGSYTGNGSSQTINCGFSNGARFFLVKRTDSTGDWWVWDTARGITAPADPALALNSTAVEVTSADAVDPDSTGIIVNQETTCNINVNGATYIYLSVA